MDIAGLCIDADRQCRLTVKDHLLDTREQIRQSHPCLFLQLYKREVLLPSYGVLYAMFHDISRHFFSRSLSFLYSLSVRLGSYKAKQ